MKTKNKEEQIRKKESITDSNVGTLFDTLIEQMHSSNIKVEVFEAGIRNNEKQILLTYLRDKHKTQNKTQNKITLKRRTTSELGSVDNTIKKEKQNDYNTAIESLNYYASELKKSACELDRNYKEEEKIFNALDLEIDHLLKELSSSTNEVN